MARRRGVGAHHPDARASRSRVAAPAQSTPARRRLSRTGAPQLRVRTGRLRPFALGSGSMLLFLRENGRSSCVALGCSPRLASARRRGELGTLAARSSVSTPDPRARGSCRSRSRCSQELSCSAWPFLRWALPGLVFARSRVGRRAGRAAARRAHLATSFRQDLAELGQDARRGGRPRRSGNLCARLAPAGMSVGRSGRTHGTTPAAFEGLEDMLGYCAARPHGCGHSCSTSICTAIHGYRSISPGRGCRPCSVRRFRHAAGSGLAAARDFGVARVSANGPCAEGDQSLDLPLGSEELHCRRPLIEGRARSAYRWIVLAVVAPQMLVRLAGRGLRRRPSRILFLHPASWRQATLWLWPGARARLAHGMLTTEQTLPFTSWRSWLTRWSSRIAEIDVGSASPQRRHDRDRFDRARAAMVRFREFKRRSTGRNRNPCVLCLLARCEGRRRGWNSKRRARRVDPVTCAVRGSLRWTWFRPAQWTDGRRTADGKAVLFAAGPAGSNPSCASPECCPPLLTKGTDPEPKQARFLSERRRSVPAVPGRTDVTDPTSAWDCMSVADREKIEYHLPTRPRICRARARCSPRSARRSDRVRGARRSWDVDCDRAAASHSRG